MEAAATTAWNLQNCLQSSARQSSARQEQLQSVLMTTPRFCAADVLPAGDADAAAHAAYRAGEDSARRAVRPRPSHRHLQGISRHNAMFASAVLYRPTLQTMCCLAAAAEADLAGSPHLQVPDNSLMKGCLNSLPGGGRRDPGDHDCTVLEQRRQVAAGAGSRVPRRDSRAGIRFHQRLRGCASMNFTMSQIMVHVTGQSGSVAASRSWSETSNSMAWRSSRRLPPSTALQS